MTVKVERVEKFIRASTKVRAGERFAALKVYLTLILLVHNIKVLLIVPI